jgi:hypothetical protein
VLDGSLYIARGHHPNHDFEVGFPKVTHVEERTARTGIAEVSMIPCSEPIIDAFTLCRILFMKLLCMVQMTLKNPKSISWFLLMDR